MVRTHLRPDIKERANHSQAPKNLPPAAKQAKILDWFKETMGVYTLKELEKLLQSVASINGMQVKEYLQALQDESLIRVEKIGSGNWYWCFVSEAKKAKESQLGSLKAEEITLRAAIADTERLVGEQMKKRDEDDGVQVHNGQDRKALLEAHGALLRDREVLDKGLACYSANDPTEVLKKAEETVRLKDSAFRWTDNIEAMESFFTNITGDRAMTAQLMHSACGDEYGIGEGLKDLM